VCTGQLRKTETSNNKWIKQSFKDGISEQMYAMSMWNMGSEDDNDDDEDNLPLEQFGEVVDRTARAEKDEMLLSSMNTQKTDEII